MSHVTSVSDTLLNLSNPRKNKREILWLFQKKFVSLYHQKQNYDATKRLLIYILLSTTCLTGNAQTNYDYDHLQRERLDRGLVAVRTAEQGTANNKAYFLRLAVPYRHSFIAMYRTISENVVRNED